MKRHECQGCGKLFATGQLFAVKNISERVAAGEPMPSGECPECGALTHEVDRKPPRRFEVYGGELWCPESMVIRDKLCRKSLLQVRATDQATDVWVARILQHVAEHLNAMWNSGKLIDPSPEDQRVRLSTDVERYPHAIIREGATGTIVQADASQIAVKLDDTYPELSDWDNILYFYRDSDVDGGMLAEFGSSIDFIEAEEPEYGVSHLVEDDGGDNRAAAEDHLCTRILPLVFVDEEDNEYRVASLEVDPNDRRGRMLVIRITPTDVDV